MTKLKRARMGRPPKPKGEVKTALIQLRVTSAEKRTMEAAAKRAGQDVSAWLRALARDAAKSVSAATA